MSGHHTLTYSEDVVSCMVAKSEQLQISWLFHWRCYPHVWSCRCGPAATYLESPESLDRIYTWYIPFIYNLNYIPGVLLLLYLLLPGIWKKWQDCVFQTKGHVSVLSNAYMCSMSTSTGNIYNPSITGKGFFSHKTDTSYLVFKITMAYDRHVTGEHLVYLFQFASGFHFDWVIATKQKTIKLPPQHRTRIYW